MKTELRTTFDLTFLYSSFFLRALYICFPTTRTKLFARSLTYTTEFSALFARLVLSIERKHRFSMGTPPNDLRRQTSLCCPHTTLHRFLARRHLSRSLAVRRPSGFTLLADKKLKLCNFFLYFHFPTNVSGQVALDRVIDLVGSSYTLHDCYEELRMSFNDFN